MKRALAMAFLAACSAAPEVRPQWVVEISTDAPLPQLGDRVVVEVMNERGERCDACRRIFGVGKDTRWPLSFGVTAPGMVRARLHRSFDVGSDGLPRTAAVIDASGILPRDPSRVSLILRMDCFGVGATCDPATREAIDPPTLRLEPAAAPGSWYLAEETDCAGAPPAGTRCIKGGLFLLGDVRMPVAIVDGTPERLVRVSPFFLDEVEVTVGAVRALVNQGKLPEPTVTTVLPCTYLGRSEGKNDAMPMSCVSFSEAQAACRARGLRLPTEAEWEYAAGSRGEERPHPWGDGALDACRRSIVGRGRTQIEVPRNPDVSTVCRAVDGEEIRPFGPVAGGNPLDVTADGIRDMGGNLAEWVADWYHPYTHACWNKEPLVDPRCDDARGVRSFRGGDWQVPPLYSAVAHRGALHGSASPETLNSRTGFRCAGSASP